MRVANPQLGWSTASSTGIFSSAVRSGSGTGGVRAAIAENGATALKPTVLSCLRRVWSGRITKRGVSLPWDSVMPWMMRDGCGLARVRVPSCHTDTGNNTCVSSLLSHKRSA